MSDDETEKRTVCQYSLRLDGSEEFISGYLLRPVTDLVMIARIKDMTFSGVEIFRSEDAEKQEFDDDLEFFQKLLETNCPKIADIPDEIIEATSFREIFEWSMHNSRLMTIQGHEEFEFEVLKATGVSDDHATVRILGSDGNWFEEDTRANYSALACLTVLDAYCNGIERYFEKRDHGGRNAID